MVEHVEDLLSMKHVGALDERAKSFLPALLVGFVYLIGCAGSGDVRLRHETISFVIRDSSQQRYTVERRANAVDKM